MAITIYLFILIELIAVSYGDLKYKKIPNYWSLLNIVVFIILLFLMPKEYQISWETFFFSGVFLFVGFLLFLLKIMGGGDSKFLSSSYLIIPVALHEQSFTHLLYVTVLVGVSLLIYNSVRNYRVILKVLRYGNMRLLKNIMGTKFPYAPVILISWLWLGMEIRVWEK